MHDPEIESAFARRACPSRHAGSSGSKLRSFDDQVPRKHSINHVKKLMKVQEQVRARIGRCNMTATFWEPPNGENSGNLPRRLTH